MSKKSNKVSLEIDGQDFPVATWKKLTKTLYITVKRLNARFPKFKEFRKEMEEFLKDDPSFEGSSLHQVYQDSLRYYIDLVDNWDDIEEISAAECFKETNLERKRIMFSILGTDRIYKELNSEVLNVQTIKKKNRRWIEQPDGTHEMEEYEFDDTYTLRRVSIKDLGLPVSRWGNNSEYIYAVQCFCSTTGREFNILTDAQHQEKLKTFDAIEGIAWTIRTPMKNFDILARQGDVIVAIKINPDEAEYYKDRQGNLDSRRITKEQYLKGFYAES